MGVPDAIKELSENPDTWSLIRSGVNPLESPKLLGNLVATNTKQRAKAGKKQVRMVFRLYFHKKQQQITFVSFPVLRGYRILLLQIRCTVRFELCQASCSMITTGD